MNIEYLKDNGIDIAVVSGDEAVIVDTQSALDLAMAVKYDRGAERIVIDKEVDRDTITDGYRFQFFSGLVLYRKAAFERQKKIYDFKCKSKNGYS